LITIYSKKSCFHSLIFISHGSATAFPALKVSAQKAYFRVKRLGRNLSVSWSEHICSDNAVGAHKLSFFMRLRTLVAAAFFAYFLEL
jgi:hypothetical protein